MTTWFTSDLHFQHKRIVEFTNRKIVTTQEDHDEWLIDLWNKQVATSDRVYHLGDFCFSRNAADWSKIIKRLNGQKFFIKGNHDSSDVLKFAEKNMNLVWYDYKQIKIDKQDVVLFHFPILSWEKQRYGSFHLHGHSHGSLQGHGKILDVGIDSAYNILGEHRLFSEQDVLEYMQQQNASTIDHH